MKKTAAILLSLTLLAGLLPARAAGPAEPLTVQFYSEADGRYEPAVATDRVSLTLDGVPLSGKTPAMIQYLDGAGRTLVPVRLVSEALGAQVIWVPDTRQVLLLRGEDKIVLTLGSDQALVNGQTQALPDGVPAGVVRWQGAESTMVPLRFVSEQLGAEVDWDQDTFTALLTTPGGPAPEPTPIPTPEPTPEPAPTPTPSPPLEGNDRGYITGITATNQTVEIATDHQPEFRVRDLGDRVAIDLKGAILASGYPGAIPMGDGLIRSVRYSPHAGDDLGFGCRHATRVVLDLAEGLTYADNVRIELTGTGLRVSVQAHQTGTVPIRPESFTVVLDAGHGGEANGATYEDILEKDINLSVTRRVQAILEGHGYHVIMTRTEDVYMDLYDRAGLANEAAADLFVSIHSNASSTNTDFQGIFTYHHPSSGRGARLAQTIQTPLAQITGGIDRGILSNDYVVLRETEMCAALVEMGFMSNHEELMRLIDSGYQDKLAQGIAEGIVQYLNSVAQS